MFFVSSVGDASIIIINGFIESVYKVLECAFLRDLVTTTVPLLLGNGNFQKAKNLSAVSKIKISDI